MTYEGWSSQGAWALALFIDNNKEYQEKVLELVDEIRGSDWSRQEKIEEFAACLYEDILPGRHRKGVQLLSWDEIGEVFDHFVTKLEDMERHELGPGYDFADEVAGDESDGVYHAIAWEWEEGGW